MNSPVHPGVLAEEAVADSLCRMHQQTVAVLQPFRAHNLRHLPQPLLLLEQGLAPFLQLAPPRGDFPGAEVNHVLRVQGIAAGPVDGREMAAVRQIGVQHQEGAGTAETGLKIQGSSD